MLSTVGVQACTDREGSAGVTVVVAVSAGLGRAVLQQLESGFGRAASAGGVIRAVWVAFAGVVFAVDAGALSMGMQRTRAK